MIINRDMKDDSGRDGYAYSLLESSSYEDPWKEEISYNISIGTPDDVEVIIQDLLLNQVDRWTSFRQKDIKKRLDRC